MMDSMILTFNDFNIGSIIDPSLDFNDFNIGFQHWVPILSKIMMVAIVRLVLGWS